MIKHYMIFVCHEDEQGSMHFLSLVVKIHTHFVLNEVLSRLKKSLGDNTWITGAMPITELEFELNKAPLIDEDNA